MNKLFVVNKPLFISSNKFLNIIKKRYNIKKAGFSGTLDPFATGTLIIGFNQYTKLFPYIKKTPKTYIATIWLGAVSKSLDIQNITKISIDPNKIDIDLLYKIFDNLIGEISYTPPIFSAKKINGIRAYNLAKKDKKVELKTITSTIYNIKLLHYNHPFITFEIEVSEGSYIRSIAQIILDKLNKQGTLSYLNRIKEGKFVYKNEKALNPIQYIDLPINKYFGKKEYFFNGKRLNINYFANKSNGKYIVEFNDFFSIIEITNNKIKYILNQIQK